MLGLFPCSAKQAGNSFLSLQCIGFHTSLRKPLKSCSSAGQTVLGLFPCAALQNRLATVFCHCNDIYWYLPFQNTSFGLKSCSSAGQTVLGLFPCAALQNTTVFCHLTYIVFAFHTSLERETVKELVLDRQCLVSSPVLLCKTGCNSFLSLQ